MNVGLRRALKGSKCSRKLSVFFLGKISPGSLLCNSDHSRARLWSGFCGRTQEAGCRPRPFYHPVPAQLPARPGVNLDDFSEKQDF